MCLIDRDDLPSQVTLDRKINELQRQKKTFEGEIHTVKTDLEDIQTHPSKLEKFAREKYFMKKDQEDLFVLIPAKKSISAKDSILNKLRSIFSNPTRSLPK